ncbi:unnamed protein product [Ectocarpus fasciculatus]
MWRRMRTPPTCASRERTPPTLSSAGLSRSSEVKRRSTKSLCSCTSPTNPCTRLPVPRPLRSFHQRKWRYWMPSKKPRDRTKGPDLPG